MNKLVWYAYNIETFTIYTQLYTIIQIQEDQDKFEESSSDDSVIDVSPYEAAVIKSRERNKAIIESLGLLKVIL